MQKQYCDNQLFKKLNESSVVRSGLSTSVKVDAAIGKVKEHHAAKLIL
jgi:hypothetical protein